MSHSQALSGNQQPVEDQSSAASARQTPNLEPPAERGGHELTETGAPLKAGSPQALENFGVNQSGQTTKEFVNGILKDGLSTSAAAKSWQTYSDYAGQVRRQMPKKLRHACLWQIKKLYMAEDPPEKNGE